MSIKPTKEQMLIALDESIAHWIRMKEGKRIKIFNAETKTMRLESIGSTYCACCNLMSTTETSFCTYCAVHIANDYGRCSNSEYKYASRECKLYGIDSPEFKEKAKAEVEFLKAVRYKLNAESS